MTRRRRQPPLTQEIVTRLSARAERQTAALLGAARRLEATRRRLASARKKLERLNRLDTLSGAS